MIRTLKTVLFQNKKVLRENYVNRESNAQSSQFSYTDVMNINIPSVITPPSDYQEQILHWDAILP